jgi:short-subunit dehydrogenase
MKRLTQRVAVVTGAASGLGRALSFELASHGCHLALIDIDAEALASMAAALRQQGYEVSHHVADVANVEHMHAVVDDIQRIHSAVHLLVNNAGITGLAPFAEQPLEQHQHILAVNLGGTLNGCALFLPLLLAQDEAHIVNISSMAAFGGMPLQTAYCASKAAVQAFTEVLAAELHRTSVRVTCVFPGPTRTGILRSAPSTDAVLKHRLTAALAAHAARPERVARVIVRTIRRNRRRVVIGGLAHLWDWSMRLCPTLTQRLLAWIYAKFSLR